MGFVDEMECRPKFMEEGKWVLNGKLPNLDTKTIQGTGKLVIYM